MKGLLLALQFLTIIPVKVKKVNERLIANSMVFFPVVGLILSALLLLLNILMRRYLGLNIFSIDIILVVVLIALTGGLHLDGVADTSDALFSGKDREKMLEIMRDPGTGALGVCGIVSVVLMKIALLYGIDNFSKLYALVLMCTLSRWAMVLSVYLFPYARQEGKAKSYIEGINIRILLLSTLIAIGIVLSFWGLKGIIVMAAVAFAAYLMGIFISKKIGGITGDTLGACNEVMEIAALFAVLVVRKVALLWNH